MKNKLNSKSTINPNAPTPVEGTQRFLHSFCLDVDSMDSIRCDVASMILINPRSILEGLSSIERLLAEPLLMEGVLVRLVEYDAGWVLEDCNDAGARAWLSNLAELLREELHKAGLV
jgi:hypothetical protein